MAVGKKSERGPTLSFHWETGCIVAFTSYPSDGSNASSPPARTGNFLFGHLRWAGTPTKQCEPGALCHSEFCGVKSVAVPSALRVYSGVLLWLRLTQGTKRSMSRLIPNRTGRRCASIIEAPQIRPSLPRSRLPLWPRHLPGSLPWFASLFPYQGARLPRDPRLDVVRDRHHQHQNQGDLEHGQHPAR